MFPSPRTYLLTLTGDKWSRETSILTEESQLVRKPSRGEGDSGEGWTQHYFQILGGGETSRRTIGTTTWDSLRLQPLAMHANFSSFHQKASDLGPL
jgi:hypothetical protein